MRTCPLITIVGPTASGKSAVALEIAARLGGEIICADARTVYTGMDIGTAKPTVAERARIPHHALDVVEPNLLFSAARFKQLALIAIEDVSCRGKVPILVGGTGLYVDAVLFDYKFREPADLIARTRLNELSVDTLQSMLHEQGIPLPENERNRRHLIRSIETGGAPVERAELRANTMVFGIRVDREELVNRINQRVNLMIAHGLEREVAVLAEKYGWDAPGMLAIGYREWQEYFAGKKSRNETIELIQLNSRRYAKRQLTWFRRNNCINWFDDPSSIVESATTFLNKTT